MRVFTHYENIDGIEYRWRTILQIGESWKRRGTIFMKNPGSSNKINSDKLPIDDISTLEHLREFDDTKDSISYEWHEFTKDNTMDCVKKLFEEYYSARGEILDGVIQIFNLFNIRGANLRDALNKLNGKVNSDCVFTTNYDIEHIITPVYIGWGYLWKNRALKKNAEEIYNAVNKHNSYLFDGIQNNRFYHPQYLMVYGKNRERCKEEIKRFINSR